MKKNILLSVFIIVVSFSRAQNPIFLAIKENLTRNHPELAIENKIIAYNVWSPDDVEARELNGSFDKTYNIYQVAKLRGGSKGVIVVNIYFDATAPTALTTLNYDGIKMLVPISAAELTDLLKGAPKNMVFDEQGREIYRNLAAGEVFDSFNRLVTR